MNKIFIAFLLCFFCTNLLSKENNDYFKRGQENFNKKNIDKAKLNFEKDIVRNTKNIESYLFLAKIHKEKENNQEFEKYLKTVLILDPKNEEALYLLITKKLKMQIMILHAKNMKYFLNIVVNYVLKKVK